jgi:dsRNA-specific ribonuclease
VEVKVGKLAARGEGSSKKEAQQQAAKNALELSR